jgi:hypothetical protein
MMDSINSVKEPRIVLSQPILVKAYFHRIDGSPADA